jgi:hypothetical protein
MTLGSLGNVVRLQNGAARIICLPSVGNTSNYTCTKPGIPMPTGACSEIPCSTMLKTRPSSFIDVFWIFAIPVHEAAGLHYSALA